MEKIKVYFSDIWRNFDINNNIFVELLSEKYEVTIDKEEPDILFFSVFGCSFLDYNCIRVFFTGEAIAPDFNLCDYALGYDDIILGDRYLKTSFWHYGQPLKDSLNELDSLQQRNICITEAKKLCKRDFCSFVYSNNGADTIRDELFYRLSEYKFVASGGRHLNNVGGAVKDKLGFMKNYKFSLAIENSAYEGYHTEKILDAYRTNTIPIYWGDNLITKEINSKSMIHVRDYRSFKELLDYIIFLDNNDSAYISKLMEPIFTDEKYIENKYEKLKSFLLNIEIGKLRRNMSFWGKRYEEAKKNDRLGIKDRMKKKIKKIVLVK